MVVTLCTLTPVHVTFVCVSLVTTTNSVIHCFGRKVLSIVKCQALSLFTMLFNFGTALPPTQKQVSYLETFAKYRSQNFPKWKSNTCLDLSFIWDFIQLVNFAHMVTPTTLREKPTSQSLPSCPSRGRDLKSGPHCQATFNKSTKGVRLNVHWHQEFPSG